MCHTHTDTTRERAINKYRNVISEMATSSRISLSTINAQVKAASYAVRGSAFHLTSFVVFRLLTLYIHNVFIPTLNE